jgi:hypothetical protein
MSKPCLFPNIVLLSGIIPEVMNMISSFPKKKEALKWEKVTTTKIRTLKTNQNQKEHQKICKPSLHRKGAGVTFDWLFFDNSKLIDFDC